MSKRRKRKEMPMWAYIALVVALLGVGAVVSYYCIEVIKVMVGVFKYAGIIQ